MLANNLVFTFVLLGQMVHLVLGMRKLGKTRDSVTEIGQSEGPFSDDAAEVEDAPELLQTSTDSDAHTGFSLLQSLQVQFEPTETQEQAVEVRLKHAGEQYNYKLYPHNIYAENAVILLGNETLQQHVPRTFRTRLSGSWASMTWHDDGSIHGLFEKGDHMIEVKPLSHLPDDVATKMTEGSPNEHGVHGAHVANRIQAFMEKQSDGHPAVDDESEGEVPANTTDSGPIEFEASALDSWGGERWYPGCYNGDRSMHEMVVAVASDAQTLQWRNNQKPAVRSLLESIVQEASFVYEKQMNIKLKIGYLEVAENEQKFGGCVAEPNVCQHKLGLIRSAVRGGSVPTVAAHHLFTACGQRFGVVGLAYVNTLCRGEFATGSNKVQTSSPWLTFAHELGHNLNGAHSFELGQGRTGGVMDYGDGKLNGHYQFNSRFRKSAMCSTLDSKVNRCSGNFKASSGSSSGSSAGPTPRRRAPSPPPPSQGRATTEGCRCRQNWALQGSGSCNKYCCNPDGDSREWCFIEGSCSRSTSNWGYCA